MARYEYECTNTDCGITFEHEQSIKMRVLSHLPCPKCGEAAKKVISQCSFRLLGSGWPGQELKRGLGE